LQNSYTEFTDQNINSKFTIMKNFSIIALLFITLHTYSQECIDYVILNIENSASQTDTIFCKVINEDEESVVVDNGYAITSLKKSLIIDIQRCARDMTPYEVYKFKGLDAVTADMFQNQNTAGAYLRKAARNTYLGAGLTIVGAGVVLTGAYWANEKAGKTACYITGGLTAATGIFFIIRAWNQVYRAGKLLDLNSQSALYLDATPEGLALSIKF
jgi:hypothetical protein